MLIPIDRPMIDARNIRQAKTYTDPSDGFTIDHENKALVHVILDSAVLDITTDDTTAIVDGSVVGQKLKIIITSTSNVIVAAFVIEDSANTKLLGDWALVFAGESEVPSWMELVWDGSDWQQTGTNDGSPSDKSGGNAHAEGSSTIASGSAAHAEGHETTASLTASHSEGKKTMSSGSFSHAGGEGSEATDLWSRATGRYSWARMQCQRAHSLGPWTSETKGEVQWTDFLLKGKTTDAAITELTSPERFVLQDESTMACTVTVSARQDDGTDHAMFKRMVVVERTGGTVALSGAAQTIGTDINPGALGGVTLSADDTNKSLKVQVTGAAGHNIAWLAHIETLEIVYAD